MNATNVRVLNLHFGDIFIQEPAQDLPVAVSSGIVPNFNLFVVLASLFFIFDVLF